MSKYYVLYFSYINYNETINKTHTDFFWPTSVYILVSEDNMEEF